MEKVARRLTDAITFIQPLIPLIDSHMVTFFTENLWEKYVPGCIRKEYDELMADNNVLDIFAKAASNIDDFKFKELNQFVKYVLQMDIAQHESLSITRLKQIMEIDNYDLKRPPLEEFMTKKKLHEVEELVEIVAALTHHTGVTHVVEIGDGKGYTSSLLALQHGIKVLGLESCEDIMYGAQKWKTKLHKHWNSSKKKKLADDSFYRQLHVEVRKSTVIGTCVQLKFPESWPLYTLGISGLHTCGDLSPVCLHLFLSKRNPAPRFLINVGCCYHLLNISEEHCEENPSGFPLSSFIKKKGFNFSRNARMMSLQSPSKQFHLHKSPRSSLMYRAVLEQLLDDTLGPGNPNDREVGRIGKKCHNFIQYVRKASSILGCNIPMDDGGLLTYYKQFEPSEKKLHFYYMLRVIIAPIIEGIILLDRLLFLKEKNVEKAYLVKLFDPVISPRCYAIVAIKSDCHSHIPPPPKIINN